MIQQHAAGAGPVESQKDGDRDDDVEDLGEHALDAVGEHYGDLATGDRQQCADRKEKAHQDQIDLHIKKQNVQGEGQIKEVNHEPRADDRDDAEVHDTGKERQHAGKEAKLAVISHLEKLRQRQSAGLTIAIHNETADGDNQGNRQR